MKHDIIAADLGCPNSMLAIWDHFKDGNVTKRDLETTLRSHQGALINEKSSGRVTFTEIGGRRCCIDNEEKKLWLE